MTRMTISLVALAAGLAAAPAVAQDQQDSSADFTYCEAGFIPGDKNRDGSLDAEEAAAMSRGAFEDVDANADGSIDRDEYAACTDAAVQGTQSASASGNGETPGTGADASGGDEAHIQSFADADTNNDDMVDMNEYMAAMQDAADEASGGSDSASDEMATGWQQPFVNVERDEEQQSREQFAADGAATFRSRDADQDTRLTEDEWHAQDRTAQRDPEVRFDMLDSNSDGSISLTEFKAQTDADLDSAREAANQQDAASDEQSVPVIYYYFYRS